MPRSKRTPAQLIAGRIAVIAFRSFTDRTQSQAAEWWGVTEREWQRYESGAVPVPMPLLKRLASEIEPVIAALPAGTV